MATKTPQTPLDQQASQTNRTNQIPTTPLDDSYARQFGEWIAGQVVQTFGWTEIGTQRLQALDTNRSILLGKVAYDAIAEFLRNGHFPPDVSVYGLDQVKGMQQAGQTGVKAGQAGHAGIVNQYGDQLGNQLGTNGSNGSNGSNAP